MNKLREFYNIVYLLKQSYQSTLAINSILNRSNNLINALGGLTDEQLKTEVNNIYSDLKKEAAKINYDTLTDIQKDFLKAYDIDIILGNDIDEYFDKLLVLATPSKTKQLRTALTLLINSLNTLITLPSQLIGPIEPFKKLSYISNESSSSSIAEIIFKEKVAIENFDSAKIQINNWYIIINSYAELLGITKSEYEIVTITKSSPTRISVKSTFSGIALLLSITTGLLELEKRIYGDRILVEQVRQNVSAPTTSAPFIDELNKAIKQKIDSHINEMVDSLIDEYQQNSEPSGIKNSVQKGIEKQYNFIINGGTVNFYLGDTSDNTSYQKYIELRNDVDRLNEQYKKINLIEGDK